MSRCPVCDRNIVTVPYNTVAIHNQCWIDRPRNIVTMINSMFPERAKTEATTEPMLEAMSETEPMPEATTEEITLDEIPVAKSKQFDPGPRTYTCSRCAKVFQRELVPGKRRPRSGFPVYCSDTCVAEQR